MDRSVKRDRSEEWFGYRWSEESDSIHGCGLGNHPSLRSPDQHTCVLGNDSPEPAAWLSLASERSTNGYLGLEAAFYALDERVQGHAAEQDDHTISPGRDRSYKGEDYLVGGQSLSDSTYRAKDHCT